MSIATLKGDVVPVKLWTPLEGVESEALTQLRQIAALPWAFHHIAVMPDVHFGKGATVGSVIAMKGALAPAAVGVDIGCGMGWIPTNLKASDLPDNLSALRSAIEAKIPVGFNSHEHAHYFGKLARHTAALFCEYGALDERVSTGDFESRARHQLGTLGGGNHFIELCLDTDVTCEGCDTCCCGIGMKEHDDYAEGHSATPMCYKDKHEPTVSMMMHSGSRNIGKTLAEIHINKARQLAHNEHLPNRDLAVFLAGTPEMEAYRHDLMWAQRYAFLNRQAMFELYKDVMRSFFPHVEFGEAVLCHHNYVSEETHFGEELIVTRKGAIAAHAGKLGIIPGSMGTRSYIVEGLGNEESFCSASHGAGRRMSRGKAKRTFQAYGADKAIAEQTAGVECRKDDAILDELPAAYKDIEQVMAYQADLVKVKRVIKQILCVKG